MTRFKKSSLIALALSPVFGLLAAVFFALVQIAVVSGLLMVALSYSLPVYAPSLNFNIEYPNMFALVATVRCVRMLFGDWSKK